MTDYEQQEWIQRLGRTREQQRRAVAELLRFAQQDEMSAADVRICRQWLERLTETHASARD